MKSNRLEDFAKSKFVFLCFVGATFACSLQQVISDWLRVRQRPDNEYASKEVYDIRTPFRWLNLNCMAHRLIISLKIARPGLIGLWQLAWHLYCFFFSELLPGRKEWRKQRRFKLGSQAVSSWNIGFLSCQARKTGMLGVWTWPCPCQCKHLDRPER